MDERVIRAMAQWPDVPDAYGWLGLDRRGSWLLQGERISNPALISFIGRNYGPTGNGGYAFQNGPQRVHVALDMAPWIAHIDPAGPPATPALIDHTGQRCTGFTAAWLDTAGQLWFEMGRGPALLRDDALLDAIAAIQGRDGEAWDEDLLSNPDALDAAQLQWHLADGPIPLRPLRTEADAALGFVRHPQPPSG